MKFMQLNVVAHPWRLQTDINSFLLTGDFTDLVLLSSLDTDHVIRVGPSSVLLSAPVTLFCFRFTKLSSFLCALYCRMLQGQGRILLSSLKMFLSVSSSHLSVFSTEAPPSLPDHSRFCCWPTAWDCTTSTLILVLLTT